MKSVALSMSIYADDHILGPENADVSLVEYGSYDCPHCRKAVNILAQLPKLYNGTLRFVYRHFQRETSNAAPSHRAAEAAEAAGKQGKFWEMHAHLLEHQDALDDANLFAYAVLLGLNTRQFADDLDHHRSEKRVRMDFQSGLDSGVHSTPTFFINGVRHDDYWDVDTLLEAICAASGGDTHAKPQSRGDS